MDLRELLDLPEEDLRAVLRGFLANVHTALPAHVVEDTADGHVSTVQPTIKRAQADPKTGVVTYAEHPIHPDVPIHHMGGGGVSKTFPNKQGDTGTLLYMARAMDAWFQSDGVQQPMEDRMHSMADAVFLSGIRSVPRKLQQVSADSAQDRSDNKHHVAELHPTDGHKVKSADPSTPKASKDFDPFTQATKFFAHQVHPTAGIAGHATDGGTTHSHGVTHDDGAFMRAANALHEVLAHPDRGALLSAQDGKHLVQAHPQQGVQISSTKAISIASQGPLSLSAPPGMLSLPAESVGGSALGQGAAAENVGELGGDLAGMLPDPQVVGLSHVVGLDQWPGYANDAAAGAGGVAIGALYRNTGALAGVSLLAVRMA